MIRRRVGRGAALLGAALLIATGCSGNSERRVVASADAAEHTVLAAIEATRASSGTFDLLVEPIGSEEFRGGVRGHFDGPDHLADAWEDLGSLEYDDRSEPEEPVPPRGRGPAPEHRPGAARGRPVLRLLRQHRGVVGDAGGGRGAGRRGHR